MSLTSSSSNWYAFSCPYDFKRAFKIAFNKFFVCIVDTPFFIYKVAEWGRILWKLY